MKKTCIEKKIGSKTILYARCTLEWNNVNRTQEKKPSNQQQEMNTGQDWETTE